MEPGVLSEEHALESAVVMAIVSMDEESSEGCEMSEGQGGGEMEQ